MTKKSKAERVQLVLDIVRKLKQFPKASIDGAIRSTDELYINLYDTEFPAIVQVKQIFTEYIQQDDMKPRCLTGFAGKIQFPEIGRTIEYSLPIRKLAQPLFVLRHRM